MAAVGLLPQDQGIEGEAEDKTHKSEIELESWSFGESNSGSHAGGTGGGAGKVSMQDFHFVMKVNKASPKLFPRLRHRRTHSGRHSDLPEGGQGAAAVLEVQVHGPPDLVLPDRWFLGRRRLATDQISFNFARSR